MQLKTFMSGLIWIIIIVLVILALFWWNSRSSNLFGSTLSASNEVPVAISNGKGQATVNLNKQNDVVTYDISVSNLTTPITGAHFHLGHRGQNGPIVKTIYFVPDGTQFVSKGQWTVRDRSEPLTSNLINELNRGNLYINVHTQRYPNGEIRGQVNKLLG